MIAFAGQPSTAEIQSVAEYVVNDFKQATRRTNRAWTAPGTRSRCPAPSVYGLRRPPWDIIEAVT